jgi:Flp pilus assembly protein TadG
MRDTKSYRLKQRGITLLLLAVTATVMFAMIGLAIDVGRMFIVKGELQAFVDSAALAAVRHLDGTASGTLIAHNTAVHGPLGSTVPNALSFDTAAVPTENVTETYSTAFGGTYDSYAVAAAKPTNTYMFMKVVVTATSPVYFLGVLPGVPSQLSMTGGAIAGFQSAAATFNNGGLTPFCPSGHPGGTAANDFGFQTGQKYTLKWGNGGETNCGGDAGFQPLLHPSEHGFVNLGQGNGNSSLRNVIEYGGYPNSSSTPSSVGVGTTLAGVPGNRGASIFSALQIRSEQDPDQSSLTWDQYKANVAVDPPAANRGNGRRVVTAPISDPAKSDGSNFYVIGFGNFLLDPGATISGSSGPICATYIGAASTSAYGPPGSDGTKSYQVMLFQ